MKDQSKVLEELRKLYRDVFAPMIQELRIEPVRVTEEGVRFRVPCGPFVLRSGGIVCGQAVASISDTVGVMALFAHNEIPRIMTTIDLTTHFQRPLFEGNLDVEAAILSNGKRMATVRVDVRQEGSAKIASSSTLAYVYIEEPKEKS